LGGQHECTSIVTAGIAVWAVSSVLPSASLPASASLPELQPATRNKLVGYLDERHYGVRLTGEEFRRIIVWLDANSEFYGAYEQPEAQARGQIVFPSLD
jgi:hypothetical protein